MKKFKLVLWLIILGFLGLFFYQNKAFFMAKQTLVLEIPFVQAYHFPEMPHAVMFMAFTLFGLLIAYFFSLMERYKSNKTIKGLSANIDSNLEMISSLKSELSARKQGDPASTGEKSEGSPGIEQKV